MRILFIKPSIGCGGAERMLVNLANYFSKKRKDKVFILAYNREGVAFSLSKDVKFISIDISSFETKIRIPIVYKVHQIIRDENIDVVFSFSVGVAKWLPLMTLGLHCVKIGSERANPYWRNTPWLAQRIRNFALGRLDGMVFTTQGCKDYYPLNIQKKSVVIPNGTIIRHRNINPAVRVESRKIIAVGNFRVMKDYTTMILGFKDFALSHTDYTLNIYGDGPEKENILKLIHDLGMQDRVILHGTVENIEQVYSESCFLVHSSKSESWCNAILEALSFGLPCIAADCDFGPREMIITGENGYLFNVGDTKELTECLKRLADSPMLLRKMSINAFSSVKTFDINEIAERYYRYILGKLNDKKII